MDGIDELGLIRSLDPEQNRNQIFKKNKNAKEANGGRSGSFFFFTQDNKYIVKTINKTEVEKLLKILP